MPKARQPGNQQEQSDRAVARALVRVAEFVERNKVDWKKAPPNFLGHLLTRYLNQPEDVPGASTTEQERARRGTKRGRKGQSPESGG